MISQRLAHAIAGFKEGTRREGSPPTKMDLQFLMAEILVALIRDNEGNLGAVDSIYNTARAQAEFEVFGEVRS